MIVVTQDRLKELLHYDPETGVFTWLVSRGRVVAGEIAGGLDSWGYWRIKIDGNPYQAHRLAFLCMTGKWPEGEIDHENTIKTANNWENLRPASRSQNEVNKPAKGSVGLKGVRFQHGKFVASIGVDHKRLHLGTYVTAEEAHAAYVKAATEHYGEFARAA